MFLQISLLVVLHSVSLLAQTPGPTPVPGPWTYPGAQCLPPNVTKSFAPGGYTPPFPTLPQQFQTNLEVVIIDKGYSISAQEYYDDIGNRASLRILQNNSMSSIIFDYKNNQVIYYVNGQCIADDLQLDDNTVLFGDKHNTGIPHVFGSNAVIHFAKDQGIAYLGNTTIKGITVDHYQSCVKWPQLNANFTLDYYFSVPTWTDQTLYSQEPVRAEVVGVFQDEDTGIWRNMHHVYDYNDFRSGLWADNSVFETPRGVTCINRKQTRAVPQLTQQYSYREEIVMVDGQVVSTADVYYDYNYKLVRYDYRPSFSQWPLYSTDSATEIHDFNTGIAYILDNVVGNCSIIPIQNASFDSSLVLNKTQQGRPEFTVRMKSPAQLFFLDNTTYTYEGQRQCRDMICDVFISKIANFSLPGQPAFNSTFEFYFLATPWTISNNIGRVEQQTTDIPIRLDVTTPSFINYEASYNIYNWDAEHPDLKRFDITSCYPDEQKINFRIDFPGDYPDSVKKYQVMFKDTALISLLKITHLSPVRVQKTSFHMEDTNSYFLGTLVEVPPALSFYRKIPGMYSAYNNDFSVTVGSEADCATQCSLKAATLPCNSFDFCPSKNLCTLSKAFTDDGALNSSRGQCDHYSRSVAQASLEVSLNQAWQLLRDIVVQGDFTIQIALDQGVKKTYRASSVSDNVQMDGGRQLSTASLMSQFNGQTNKALKGHDDLILTGRSIDDCASSCMGREEWVCNSFEFCFDSGYCILSKLHPDEVPSLVINKQYCDLYARKYTSMFTQTPGTTVLSSSTVIYQNIFTADECGMLCVQLNEFPCLSFDYCGDISTCYLGKTHFYDVPSTQVKTDPLCNHYSRNYLTDFKQNPRKLIKNVDDRIIAGVDVNQCAKLCVQEESFSCATFNYCGNFTECRLTSTSMKGIGQVTLEANLWCDIYSRQYFPDGTPYVASGKVQKYYQNIIQPPAKTGYSGGSMAGIAFGMLIVGIIIAAGVIFGWMKFRRPANDDGLTVAFKNKEESEN